jgi:glycosyltransferase involved in cell wall biosynthesis
MGDVTRDPVYFPPEVERRAKPRSPQKLSVMHASDDGPSVSVIIAAMDEEDSLPLVLRRLPGGLFEVILVDGNSADRTIEVALAERPDCTILRQPGCGKGDALRAGFNAASGDILVAIDADGSTNPAEIPAFVGHLLSGADYVKGSRFVHGGGTADMTFTRKMGNLGLMWLVMLLFGIRYTDLNYGFTGFWRRELGRLDLRSEGFEIETEMNLRAAVTGMRVVEVASFERLRIGGEAHLVPLKDGWRVLKEIIKQRFRGWGELATRMVRRSSELEVDHR